MEIEKRALFLSQKKRAHIPGKLLEQNQQHLHGNQQHLHGHKDLQTQKEGKLKDKSRNNNPTFKLLNKFNLIGFS